ncbi:hypothetical protein [Dethiothermospora halolimnae]|uniref:hypothetical protein n=1 Tax=Dethiothermospora halolimnae TaxID=3114390 RepID=UPI003CCC12CA
MRKIGILIASILLLSIVGCSGEETVSQGIDEGVMGYKDYFGKIDKGERAIMVYEDIEGNSQLKRKSETIKKSLEDVHKNNNISVKSKNDLTEKDMKENHIMIFGNPSQMKVFENNLDKLPFRVKDSKLYIGDKTIVNDSTNFNYIIPNPYNKDKYLMVSGALKKENLIESYLWRNIGKDFTIEVNLFEKYDGNLIKKDNKWVINGNLKNVAPKDDFIVKESEHFIFHYSDISGEIQDNIDNIIEEREETYKLFTSKLGFNIDKKIDYYVFAIEDMKNMYTNKWTSTALDEIYEFKDKRLYKYGIYEYLMEEKIGSNYFLFVRNGLYYTLLYDDEKTTEIHKKAKNIINSDKYIPFEYLNFYTIPKEIDKNVFYSEVISFSKYLEKEYGLDKYVELYKISINNDLEDSFYKVYGKDLLELSGEWQDYLNK